MDSELARRLAVSAAWGRVALGVTAIVAPSVPLRPWVGRNESWRPRTKMLARSLGARDLALGLGVIIAQRHEAPTRGWVEAGGMADTGDILSTLLHWKVLPKAGRLTVLVAAASGVAVARMTAATVDA